MSKPRNAAKTASVLGEAYIGLGRFAEAEPLVLNAYPSLLADRGANHARTTAVQLRI